MFSRLVLVLLLLLLLIVMGIVLLLLLLLHRFRSETVLAKLQPAIRSGRTWSGERSWRKSLIVLIVGAGM